MIDVVILVHGIVKSPIDFWPVALYLRAHGYRSYAPFYSVRHGDLPEIAERVWKKIQRKGLDRADIRLHFVAHSLGGLIVDEIIRQFKPAGLGRVVMWGTPLQGCEYADAMNSSRFWGPLYRKLYGKAGLAVRVSHEEAARFVPMAYEVGMIAGTRSYNFMARWHLNGIDAHDGIVPLARTKREGLRDHLTLKVSHPALLISPTVWRQTVHFLKNGCFARQS